MIILHASWRENRLFLWAENTPAETFMTPKSRGRKAAIPKPLPFPYDSGQDGLVKISKAIQADISIRKKDITELCVWLPTIDGIPLASSPLVAENPDTEKEPYTAPWFIKAYPMNWDETCILLCACIEKPLLAHGIAAGNDLLWWAQILRFAGALTLKEAFLPEIVSGTEYDIESGNRKYYGIWQPAPDASDHEYLAELCLNMPDSCRCIGNSDDISPPDVPKAHIAENFLKWAVDSLVRSKAPKEKSARRSKHDSVHDAWLDSLENTDPTIIWNDSKQIEDLKNQIKAWKRPIRLEAQAKARLCFRLEEPEAEDGKNTWAVRYLLQPYEDRSLLVNVSDFWKPRSKAAIALKKMAGDTTEYLLSALGQASGLCPAVAESMKLKNTGGHQLTTEKAYSFLTGDAQLLESAGFGVILPSWWAGKGGKTRISLKASIKSPKMQSSSALNLETLATVNWEVALGDSELSLKELEQLARMKTSLVKMRGSWVEVDADQIKQAIAFLKKQQDKKMSASEIIRMAIGAGNPVAGLTVEGIKADGWIGTLLERLDKGAKPDKVTPSENFKGQLRPYQQHGLSWLSFLRTWGLGACLADDMGLGKTIQTLALVSKDREKGEKRPTLLLCPTSVVNNWKKESEKFTPDLEIMIHHGAGRKKRETFTNEAEKSGLVISSFGLLQRDIEFLKSVNWAGIILDEAQNIKNPETKQAKAARMLEGDYRIALTGTPVENHVGDLWSVMEFLNPGLLGTQTSFKNRFFTPIQTARNEEASALLKKITGPFILRRLKTDKSIISDLPDKQEMKVYCSLTKEQATIYAAVLKEMEKALNDSEGIQRKGIILATISKLKQVCNHPAQFLGDYSEAEGRSGKLARLTEMMEEIIESGEKTLIFSQFTEMGEILKKHLQNIFGVEAMFLHGGVSKKKRDHMVERFQNEADGPQIFILSLKAGGTGLNLTKANHVFHFDRWWNPSVENQATDRAFRIGQTKNVQVHKFICAGTFEERIDEMIEKKMAISENIVGTGENWITEMSAQELKEILALSKDAVGD